MSAFRNTVIRFSLTLWLIAGCGRATPTEKIALESVRTVSLQETDSLFLGDFYSITITSAPFRVYIPDQVAHQIGVFDSLGRIVRFIGRKGEGPGELRRPTKVFVHGDRVYVKESHKFTLFDTTGHYIRSMHLPEGIYTAGRWSLNRFEDQFVIAADDVSQHEGDPVRVGPRENTVALLDSSFQHVTMIGQFPALYQQRSYTEQWRHLDIAPNGLMAVCYALLPNVDLYDLSHPDKPLIRTITLEHPNYRHIDREMPMQLPIPEITKIMSNTSQTLTVWIVRDAFVIVEFANRGSDGVAHYYAIVSSIVGEQLATLTLPGPIMARDSKGQLYIRLSNVPDYRRIGVFDLKAE